MQCKCCEAALLQSKPLHEIQAFRPRAILRKRIYHHVTHEMYTILRDAFLAQILIGEAICSEQVIA
jgi:hypothetical protein